MMSIVLHVQPTPSVPPHPLYRIAGRGLLADTPLPELAAYARGTSARMVRTPRLLAEGDGGELRRIYRGPGWIGNTWRQVQGDVGPHGYRLDIEGVATLSVSGDGRAIQTDRVVPSCAQGVLAEALLGPALILALALDGVFCLHASAAVFHGQVVAFVADAHSGKSTLARHLDRQREAGWRRIADDVLPVAATAKGLLALPHFPQLKVPAAEQPALGQPERLPLGAIVLLDGPGSEAEGIQADRLSLRQGMLALVRHTVAARLYDQSLLARHMEFCAAAASSVPLWRLRYPHRLALLPHVGEIIAERLMVGVESECVA